MTSTNDGKEVKSYQSITQKGKTYYIEFYKSLEAGLSSDCDLRGRTKHLCEAWRRIHSLCQHSTSTTHPHLLSWLQRHTAKIILQTEWQSSTSKNEHTSLIEAINDFITESQEAIKARNGKSTLWEGQLLQRAEWFKKTLLSPWGHATLKTLLDPQHGSPSDEEFLEWLKEERGIMVVTRLRQLAASKCDDLALSLATALMDRVRAGIETHTDAEHSDELKEKRKPVSPEPKFAEILKTQAGFTSDIWELLVDIEFVLLLKCDKRSRCIELAKLTPLRTCYQLVERLENRLENSPKEKKLWKNAKEVATLIAQVTIARCMVIGGCVGACRSALYWCARALTRLVAGARLVADTVALAAPAATSRHLHTLAVAVHAQSTESMKPFVCELYVRALTAGMNELERLKMKTEKETEARALEQTLSSWFTSLGSLLGGSARVQCECTLTAFSVHPSPFMYEAIKKAPDLPPLHVDIQEKQEAITSEFGSWANDSRSQTNLVKTSETLNLKQHKQQSNILSTAILTEGEALGLSPVLCQDIAVLLSGPRLKTLSWDMDRDTLLDNCRNYMERTHGGTRALTTELKYLNLDPKEFQHLPEEDDEEENDIFYGIEKGYEHLVEFQPEEIWENATNSQGNSDSPYSSSLDSDCSVVKLKKKSKRHTVNLSEDSDPLSLIAEAKRKAKKKERPHSKERNKDSGRKKTIADPLDIQEQTEKDKFNINEKKKNKPGRKKKDKLLTKTGPLSNLIGMKITKARETGIDTVSVNSINDSDYESQGKFSLNSINSEISDNVVFDGLYSMDELKSPEVHTETDKLEILKNNEFCVVNGAVSINKLPIAAHCVSDNTYSECNVGNITPQCVDDRNKEDCIPPIPVPSSLPANINNVTEEVKKKITRLIDFRRHKNTKHRVPERNDASLTSSNDSVHTNISNGINGHESNFLNSLKHCDISNSIKRIECNSSNSLLRAATSKEIKNQENKKSNCIQPDISNGIKRFEIKSSNNTINTDLLNSNKECEYNFLNSLTYFGISNGMKRPENETSNYSMYTHVSNRIKRSEDNFQNHVTPKVVTIPNIPKVFISKIPVEETGQLHIINNNNNVNHTVEHLSQKNDHKKPTSHFTVCNTSFNTITESQLKNECINQNVLKEKLLDMPQIQNPNEFTPEELSKPKESFEPPKQNKFQNFLKELQKSINAGAAVNSNKSLATQTDTTQRVVKPISRVTPVIPSVKKNDIKIPQTGQQSPPERLNSQKKIDNSLNTFSRLSYMHKNRQNDSKLKQVVDALVELQNINLRKCPLPKGQEQAMEDNKNVKTNYLHSKMNVNKAITFSVPSDNTQTIRTKAEKLNKTTIQTMKTRPFGLKINATTENPQLNFVDTKNEKLIRNRPSEKKNVSDIVGPISSSLSEKDQNDLLLLLQQQNKLNKCSVAKRIVATSSEGNNVSTNQSPFSGNHIFNKHHMDKPNTSKISKPKQIDKSPQSQKIQKSCEFNKPENNPLMSRILSTTPKTSRSLLKNCDLDQRNFEKTEINKSDDLSNDVHNKPSKGTTSTDWESVMNAILAQKTPSRGPNALDVALNKSSFAKAFADSIRDNKIQDEKVKLYDKFIVSKSDKKHNNKSATKISHSEKDRCHNAKKGQKHETKKDSATSKHASQASISKNKTTKNSLSTSEILNTNSNFVNSLPNSSIIPNSNALGKKISNFGTTKRLSTDAQKQFTCPLPKEDDPFISGIAHSDYDLLEELMDDDLRQEIGELSSDEDNFDISSHNALKKSITDVEKHTNEILNKSSDSVVITKSDVSILQHFPESESNRTMPVSIFKCDSGVRNIYSTPANQSYIDNNSELQEGTDNMKIYKHLNVRAPTPANNVITSYKETHNKNNLNNNNTNKNMISTKMNSPNLLLNTIVPQTFGNLVLVESGVTYEQISSSQTTLPNNVNTSPVSTYHDINKTSEIALCQTTPSVSPVIENKIVSVTASQDIPRVTPGSLSAAKIESPTQFGIAKITKATTDIAGVCNNEVCSTKSEGNNNLDDKLKDNSCKKGQTQLNLDTSKNNERQVLSEVQEKQNFFFEKKDQDDLKSTRVAIGNDIKNNNNPNRLEMKRLCIINRKTHHYSSEKPIPLSYMPLISSSPNSGKIKTELNKQGEKINDNPTESNKPQRLESLLNVKIQKIQNETNSKISKENKSEKNRNIKNESEKSKISKDNKTKSVNCRRILLRSSNKIHHRSTIIDTSCRGHENYKLNEVKHKISPFDCNETSLSRERVPKPISKKRDKESSNKSKHVDNNGDYVISKKITRKKRKKKENLNIKLDQFSTNVTDLDLIDIEDQILGSKIPKNEISGPITKLKSNNASDNTEVSFVNAHSLVEEIRTCNKVSKFVDVQTQNDVIEVYDSELTDDRRITEKTFNNVITPRVEATEKGHICETNKIEKHGDLIDLTLENKEPAKTAFIPAEDVNKNDRQKNENSICNQPPIKEPNIIINRKLQNQNCSSESNYSSSTAHKDNNLSGIPQAYKDSIKILPLPPDSCDPLRKFVRIKLPNGRTFKATSYGTQDVDFDTLFSNPSLKSVLLDGLTDKTRYTLNIKQVATTTVDNAKTVVETRIQEIKLQAKNPTGPMETIDLLSDDEDSVTYQHFKTEFGDFKIRSLENNIFSLHQKKLDQNCRVKLNSLNLEQHVPELNVCDISNTKINNIEGKVSSPQSEEIVNTNVETTIQNDSDIIDIIDISNDTSNFITTNISEERTTFNEAINEQTLHVTDAVLSTEQSLLSDNHQSKLSSNKTVIDSDLENILCSSLIPKYDNCYVKLVNCDDVVKTYEKLKLMKLKCFIDRAICNDDTGNLCTQVPNTNTKMEDIGTLEKQCEANKQNMHALSRSYSDFSFEDLIVGNTVKDPMLLLESGRTSPVINAFEKIASLNNYMSKKDLTLSQLIPTYTCVAEWFVLKPQLSSRSKENQFTNNCNRDILRSDLNTCVSEWYVSKPNLSCQSKIRINDNNQNRNSCNLDLKSFNNVPKLTTIVNKYLHNNSIMDQIKSISAEKRNLELNYSHNLKRKLSVDDDNDGGRKLTKIETIRNILVTDYGQDTYNSITSLKPQNNLDNLETESFDFLTVCYESDRESDIASNNSESILAEHANLFDDLVCNEEKDLIFNDCNSELLQTNANCETFSKEHNIGDLGTYKSCLNSGLVLQYNNIKTETLSTHTVQSSPDKLIKILEADDLCKDIPKKSIAEDHKVQNILDLSGNTLETNGIFKNDEDLKSGAFMNKVESQSKIHEVGTGGNDDDKNRYEILDTKDKKNEDAIDIKLQDNCINNRKEISSILDNITSKKIESSNFSTNTLFCEITPITFETAKDGKNKPIAKCTKKNDSTSILPNTHVEHSDKQAVDIVNNDSENTVMKVIVSEDPFGIRETDEENIQFNEKCDQSKILHGNLDHEYAAVYEIEKNVSEVKSLKSATETEDEKCVFVIDDDTILTDDTITETIVEMHNDEILHDNYIEDEFAFNNKELISIENIVESDYDKTFDKVETKYIEQQEKDNEKYSKLDSYNKDSTTDISHPIDSIKNSPDILKVNIECPNKNTSCVQTDMKRTKFDKSQTESLDSSIGVLEIYADKTVNEDSEHFKVLIPDITYAKFKINNALNNKNLKRKIGMTDMKIVGKRYRKSKNIDNPFKQFSTDTLYSKEFAGLYNYISSVKFSFSLPFHKENIDVPKMLTDWPIKNSYSKPIELETNINDVLFVDLENKGLSKVTDPLEQTLSEELSSEYDENKYTVCGINENNFNMGFGEGSGRVIQNLKDSKFSAATLSDVKQIQPFLLSEDYDGCMQDQNAVTIPRDPKKDDQLNKIRHYLSYIHLKDKVQAFFRKTSKELNLITERNLKSKQDQDVYDTTIFPFGLTHPDFIEPGPVEAVVHVVQVGQLPVTAAAQNPVTCDPRVTQVSDASPPQCSENSSNDDSQTPIKTEYTELTTADLSLPLLPEYATHNQVMESQEDSDIPVSNENIPIETEIKSVVKIELMEELSEEKLDQNENLDNCKSPESNKEMLENVDYTFDTNSMNASEADSNLKSVYNSEVKDYNIVEALAEQKQQNVSSEKTDQIAHAMNAAGISTTETVTNNAAHTLINILPENFQTPINNYTKALPNTMSLQQALAQILPPVLNQNGENNQQVNSTSVTPQVLHIVQGKNAPGSQITLVDNSQQSVINAPNSAPVLHFVQNKSTSASSNANGNIQSNTFSGLSLVDTGLQQGGNQLLQIVNTGNQKTNNASQLLKQVNLLTNLTNAQGSNEQKMVQFLCKSADGKAIQLNGPHPRSMVLRIQPVESPNIQANATKSHETPDISPTQNLGNHIPNKEVTSQQEIKSRSVYEENYAKFIQNSSAKQVVSEKSTSLPKFNQAFGKQGYQDGDQKQNEINGTSSQLPSLNTSNENSDCAQSENALKIDHIGQMTSSPLLLRKSPAQTTQPQSNYVQQIKQTISPINIQSMHGSVIYRQIPVNLSGGQTINLITVPNTEMADEQNQKQQSDVKFMSQNEMEQSIIKIVPQSQPAPNVEVQQQEENNPHININNENPQTPQQPVLTQMRIKLPMLSKTPQMVSGARVVRPSFFQIQRNVIGANQQVYQQLVLTAAPPLGHQTAIRLPQTQNARQLKVPNDNPTSSESQMSSSTLEQLREFDLVLEQVKERSTVQPNANTTAPFSQLHGTSDTTDGVIATNSTSTEPTQQVFYSISNNQPLNMSYVSRKPTIPTPTTSTYVRSPDSSGIVDSPPSSSHTQIPHTVTSDSTTNDTPVHHKPTKSSKSKSRPKASSNPPNTLKLNTVPPKTSTQKPLEDEQTTQRILYILAEYKEQVENSPDKDKPAPRRRTNLPPNPGSSKRKKSSSNSRRPGGRDLSPVHGDDTCRTMGSEDSSCGTSQGDCNDCLENHSPQESPRKVVRKLSFEQETPVNVPRQIPQRNVIVADGQTITVARGTSGKPTTAVLMPANYILPVSMVKGGQQIAIVTNRGPKLLTVTSGEGGTTNALLLQRLITPAGLKPVLTRPGVRHVRLPAAALHSLQAFNIAPVTNINPPDSTVSPAPAPTPPDLVDTRANTSPWTERDSQEAKPDRGSSPEGSELWNLPTAADPNDYSYEETVRTDNMDRTVLDPIPDRYSPDMEAQRIFDKMFDVDSKKSYLIDSHADSPRCGYDIDTSDCDDKAYHQIVHKKEGALHRQHRLTHVSAAALRHKYAILEHELRLQKSLSEECEDLGVDSPSASELFPEAELLFAASPAHDNTQDQAQHSHSHTPQPTHSCISQPDIDDQIATDQLLPRDDLNDQQDLQLGLEDVGIVTVSEDGLQTTIALDHEEFARSHPNTTFHSEPTDETEMQPFTITGIKGRHITSTIFHSHRPSGTVLMTPPQTTVISQAMGEGTSIPNTVKYSDIENMIDALPSVHENSLPTVLVKDDGISRFNSILTDSRELHLSNTASAIVHSTGNATQVIRRVCCEDIKRDRDTTYMVDESHALIAGDDAKIMAEDSSRDGTMESMHGGVEEDPSSPERHTELFWESNSASERSDSRRPLDFSSDSDKCCKSPFEETNSTDSGGVGTHLRLDSVIKEARGFDRGLRADCSSAEDTHPPLRTYPPKRLYHSVDGELDRSLSGKTGVGDLSEVRRRASGRGVVKRGCHCCNGSPAPPRPKKSRQKKLITTDFTTN